MDIVRRLVARWLEARPKPYAAIFLDPESQRRLVLWWKLVIGIPLLGDIKAHHMTIKFNPSQEELGAIPLGEQGSIRILGYAADEKGQAVLVQSSIRSYNQHPHITVAVAPGVSAAYSNELLAKGHVTSNGPKLRGVVGVQSD